MPAARARGGVRKNCFRMRFTFLRATRPCEIEGRFTAGLPSAILSREPPPLVRVPACWKSLLLMNRETTGSTTRTDVEYGPPSNRGRSATVALSLRAANRAISESAEILGVKHPSQYATLATGPIRRAIARAGVPGARLSTALFCRNHPLKISPFPMLSALPRVQFERAAACSAGSRRRVRETRRNGCSTDAVRHPRQRTRHGIRGISELGCRSIH